ncbi:hypothetical protein GCM10009584_20660 [Ornithinimicrobium humiphilum]|uniref:Uncharacterized protein n=1 Tax=Ornithinimicrobium humiphilum TaxID=125288 RepID=A0A543KNJ7_9MICO|nr:hypothetical protein [Ornithinimicrobium humiphilum]TQM96634.1 hypothetical protein FB476_1510 [Ornithinimicrobium humiphilum]
MSATTQQFDETKHPRGEGGRFTTKPCSEADVDLAGPAAPGEHLFGEASVRADRWGQVVTVQGPTLFLGAAIPEEHAQDPEYLDRRWHRIEAFVAEEYDAKVSRTPGDDGPVMDVQLSWEMSFEDAKAEDAEKLIAQARQRLLDPASQLPEHLRDHVQPRSGVQELQDALEEEDFDGRTRFSSELDQYLTRTDAEAQTPRGITLDPDEAGLTYPADVDQESLDRAVASARDYLEILHTVRRPEARDGLFIAVEPTGRLAMFAPTAWRQPTEQPLLPWRAPNAMPVAKVDMDGHASLLTVEETPCKDCGEPLEDKASPNMRRVCMACTGEWDDEAP